MTVDVLLLGGCGLERVADALRKRGRTAAVGGWTQVELVARLSPALVYVDLYSFELVAPLTTAAISGHPLPSLDLAPLHAVVAALRGHPVVYRGPRRPSIGAFGLLESHPALDAALDRLDAVVAGERVLPVAGLWGRTGFRLDDVRFGLAHGEPEDIEAAAVAEAGWVDALWAARVCPPLKCVVVDLDDTLIRGRITDDDFADRNPAWLPDGEEVRHAPIVGWWRLDRGLHEALRVVQARGILLALASRNDLALVRARFRKRPVTDAGDPGTYGPLPAPLLDALALGMDDFAALRVGHGLKSEMCRQIAEELGIGLDTLAFLDDSAFEREEVRRHAPEVLVVEEAFRETLLHGARFVPWARTSTQRATSYRSRAAVLGAVDVEAFLRDLDIQVGLRRAVAADLPRVHELTLRTNQLALTAARTEVSDGDEVFVGWCRDRLADHGIVNAAIVRDGALIVWATSCRVLPHRVAASFLALLRRALPDVRVYREDTGRNAATIGLIAESDAGVAPWVRT